MKALFSQHGASSSSHRGVRVPDLKTLSFVLTASPKTMNWAVCFSLKQNS
jgi:hypothetical protein